MNAQDKLAIDRLRDRWPLDSATVDGFLARHEVPIVEGACGTFLYRGEAEEVALVHRMFGRPDHLPLRGCPGPTCGIWSWSCPRDPGSSTSWRWPAAGCASRSTTR